MCVEQILFFDGVCNLCNGTVQWVLRHDTKKAVVFAALQSESAQLKLVPLGVDITALESLILLEDGVVYSHSDAVLHLARAIGAPWSWAFFLRIVPKFIRDGLYRFIAKNRYAWFGRQESCMMPTPELKKRFLT
jgi:predicted DCC family thiol-disulfide oxidoreductase YuxK